MGIYDNLKQSSDTLKDTLSEIRELEDEFNGSDGLPKADREEILSYVGQNNSKSPREAFMEMKKKELETWKKDQLSKPTTKDNLEAKAKAALKGLL